MLSVDNSLSRLEAKTVAVHFCRLCGTATAVFIFMEGCVLSRQAHWLGFTGESALRCMTAVPVYFAVLSACALFARLLIRRFLGVDGGLRANTFAVLVAAVILWEVLAALTSAAGPFVEQAIAVLFALVIGLETRVWRGKDGGVIGFLYMPWIMASLSALAVLHLARVAFLMNSVSDDAHIVLATLWLVALGVGGALAPVWRGKTRPMKLRTPLILFAAGLTLPAGLTAAPGFLGGTQEGGRKNVVIITADALRADYCSIYGGSTQTPNLEALAKGGAIFERAYSLSPWTMPSVGGLFASKYPPGITPGASDDQRKREMASYGRLGDYWLNGFTETYVDALRDHGYVTGAFIGNPLVAQHRWLLKGLSVKKSVSYLDRDLAGFFRGAPLMQEAIHRIGRRDMLTRRPFDTNRMVTQHGLAFLRHNRKKNFFLWLHYYDPHFPLSPPQKFRPKDAPWEVYPPPATQQMTPLERIGWLRNLTERDKEGIRNLYRGEIMYLDESVGRIMRQLGKQGLEKSTYIVFSSDHGEELHDRRWEGHGHTLFEEQVRVPLIVWGPGVGSASVSEPVSAIDIMPTVAALVGTSPLPFWRGRSLAKSLLGEEPFAGGVPCFVQATSTHLGARPKQGVIYGRYKLIRDIETKDYRLYDLINDPGEREDLSGEFPELAGNLRGDLDRWTRSFPATFSKLGGMSSISMTEEDLGERTKELEALGYLD